MLPFNCHSKGRIPGLLHTIGMANAILLTKAYPTFAAAATLKVTLVNPLTTAPKRKRLRHIQHVKWHGRRSTSCWCCCCRCCRCWVVGCWLLVVGCSWWLFLEMTYVTHALSILVLSLGRAEVPPWQFHQRHQLPAHETFIVAWNLTCATCNVDLATMFPMMMIIWHTESARCLHPK